MLGFFLFVCFVFNKFITLYSDNTQVDLKLGQFSHDQKIHVHHKEELE